jgi:predicted RNase H-like HicB family nuclease
MRNGTSQPDETLYVTVEFHDGQEDSDDGQPYYVAICPQIGVVTDGETLDDLLKNLREAIELAFEDEDPIAAYHVVANPRLSLTMEIADYAQIA